MAEFHVWNRMSDGNYKCIACGILVIPCKTETSAPVIETPLPEREAYPSFHHQIDYIHPDTPTVDSLSMRLDSMNAWVSELSDNIKDLERWLKRVAKMLDDRSNRIDTIQLRQDAQAKLRQELAERIAKLEKNTLPTNFDIRRIDNQIDTLYTAITDIRKSIQFGMSRIENLERGR